jgi:zinc protease
LEKEKMARYGFTAAEIDQVKRSLLADMERAVSEKDRQRSSNHLDGFVAHFIWGQPVTSAEWELEAVSKLLPHIGAAEIAAAAKGYFAHGDLSLFVSAPESEAASLPSKDRVRSLVRQAARARIPRPKNEALDDKFLDTPPAPGSIVAESSDPASGTVQWELGNGARVILKETKNKNNEIVLYALARGGTTSVPEEQIVSARLAAEMLGASGLGHYSRTDLMKKLADKQISISCSIASFTRDFQGTATRGDLRTLFELVYLYFTQPRIDQDAVAAILDSYRTGLAQRDQNPEAVFFDERTRTLYSDNPWFRPMALSDLEKVNPDHAMALVRKALNPADYTFVFTGNIDTDALRALVETYLASIPQGETWNTWTDRNISSPGKLEKIVHKGQEEKSQVIMDWVAPQEYSESRDAAADVLSEYLENRLLEITRKQMGGTYSLSVGVSQSLLPPGGELTMYVYFPCDPSRVQELRDAILGELDLAAKGTIDQDAFQKSVEALKKSFEESIQSNTYISRNYAISAVLYDRPLSRLEQWPALYDAVTPRDLQQTVEKLLPRGPVTVILYPENSKEGR